jgi:hypothetical protein
MTDFNKEFDLLQKYINYRVDWYSVYLRDGRIFYINIDAIPCYFTPKGLIAMYQQIGWSFVPYKVDTSMISEHKCLTFEQFKQTL